MKTMLFCTCWLDKPRDTKAYVNWFAHHAEKFNQNVVFYLIDDGSDEIILRKFLKECNVKSNLVFYDKDTSALKENGEKLIVVSMSPHLGRSAHLSYSGWWRSFLTSYVVAKVNNYDKIIHIESDFYVISNRMIDYMSDLSTGWKTAYCNRHKFIETAIQVVCKNYFNVFGNFYEKNINNIGMLKGRLAEEIIKKFSSKFNKDFKGDRYGEFGHRMGYDEIKISNFDYYGQLNRSILNDAEYNERSSIIDMLGAGVEISEIKKKENEETL